MSRVMCEDGERKLCSDGKRKKLDCPCICMNCTDPDTGGVTPCRYSAFLTPEFLCGTDGTTGKYSPSGAGRLVSWPDFSVPVELRAVQDPEDIETPARQSCRWEHVDVGTVVFDDDFDDAGDPVTPAVRRTCDVFWTMRISPDLGSHGGKILRVRASDAAMRARNVFIGVFAGEGADTCFGIDDIPNGNAGTGCAISPFFFLLSAVNGTATVTSLP